MDRADFYARLGAELPDERQGVVWQSLPDYVRQGDENSKFMNNGQDWDALSQPWSPKEYPAVVKWLGAMQQPLDQIVKGVKRPHWFCPIIANKDASSSRLVAANLPLSSPRSVARALVARAMLAAHEKQYDRAWEDLMAIHRLGRHIDRSTASLVEMLVGHAIDGVARRSDCRLANLDLPPKLLVKMRQDLASLPDYSKASAVLDSGERFFFLDAVMGLASGQADGILGNATPAMKMMLGSPVDWNETLRIGNTYYDRIVAISDLPTHTARVKEWDAFDSELNSLGDKPSVLSLAASVVAGNARKRLGTQMGKTLVALLLPSVQAARTAEARSRTEMDLTKLHVELAIHRAKHGEYPAALKQLETSVPLDRFTAEPLKYSRQGNRFRLYSVGPNMQDDDGAEFGGTKKGDISMAP